MKIELTKQEKDFFQALAKSSQGKILESILEKIVFALVDIRNIDKKIAPDQLGNETRSRELAAQIIQESLVDRLKGYSKEIPLGADPDQFN